MAVCNPIQDLYEGRYNIGVTGKGRRKWKCNASWIIDEYDKMIKDSIAVYMEYKDKIMDPGNDFEKWKISTNIYPEVKKITERGTQIAPALETWPATSNKWYGRLPWYTHSQHQKYRFP